MAKMIAGQALVKVLERWGVDHVYGIPGGSINHTLEGLYLERDKVRYIQVRHEETGALAASADAKFSGTIGVCFGSAGPGATHLMNGLYDAKMDRVPLLALVGQVPQFNMNTNYFQEMDEIPVFADVAVYNQCVTTADQIPYVINQAIREAYRSNGPAVVVLPEDLTAAEIDYEETTTPAFVANDFSQTVDPEDVAMGLRMIAEAKHPVLYAGRGLLTAREQVEAFSEKFSIPVINTVPATGVIRTDHPNALGPFGRLGGKPALEALEHADLILFMASQFPFARYWPKDLKILQINTSIYDLGKTVDVDAAVLADAKTYLEALTAAGNEKPADTWLEQNRVNKANWDTWLDELAEDDSKGLNAETITKRVAQMAGPNDTYAIDTGNVSEWGVRGMPMNQNQRFAISGLFATMGFGLPAGIAGALTVPDAQAWALSGDGGFSMVAPDIITEARYELPVINIVFSNNRLGFIYKEQIDTGQHLYGVDLTDADWAAAGEAFGGIGFTIRTVAEADEVFAKVKQLQASGNKRPLVINAIVRPDDPVATDYMPLDPVKYGRQAVDEFAAHYGIDTQKQPSLGELLRTHGDTL